MVEPKLNLQVISREENNDDISSQRFFYGELEPLSLEEQLHRLNNSSVPYGADVFEAPANQPAIHTVPLTGSTLSTAPSAGLATTSQQLEHPLHGSGNQSPQVLCDEGLEALSCDEELEALSCDEGLEALSCDEELEALFCDEPLEPLNDSSDRLHNGADVFETPANQSVIHTALLTGSTLSTDLSAGLATTSQKPEHKLPGPSSQPPAVETVESWLHIYRCYFFKKFKQYRIRWQQWRETQPAPSQLLLRDIDDFQPIKEACLYYFELLPKLMINPYSRNPLPGSAAQENFAELGAAKSNIAQFIKKTSFFFDPKEDNQLVGQLFEPMIGDYLLGLLGESSRSIFFPDLPTKPVDYQALLHHFFESGQKMRIDFYSTWRDQKPWYVMIDQISIERTSFLSLLQCASPDVVRTTSLRFDDDHAAMPLPLIAYFAGIYDFFILFEDKSSLDDCPLSFDLLEAWRQLGKTFVVQIAQIFTTAVNPQTFALTMGTSLGTVKRRCDDSLAQAQPEAPPVENVNLRCTDSLTQAQPEAPPVYPAIKRLRSTASPTAMPSSPRTPIHSPRAPMSPETPPQTGNLWSS